MQAIGEANSTAKRQHIVGQSALQFKAFQAFDGETGGKKVGSAAVHSVSLCWLLLFFHDACRVSQSVREVHSDQLDGS